jgi:hypothetical protein
MVSSDPLLERRKPWWPNAVGILGVGFLVIAIGWATLERVRDAQQPPLAIPGTANAPLGADVVNTTGTDAEAALDFVSGGRIDLVVHADDQSPCPDALACVYGSSEVHISHTMSRFSDDQLRRTFGTDWHDVMLHEYAHTVQFHWWYDLSRDADYLRLFVAAVAPEGLEPQTDYPLEHAADCMAAAVDGQYRNTYPGECTGEQLVFARTIWDGSFLD